MKKTTSRTTLNSTLAIAACGLMLSAVPAKAISPYPLVPLNISGIMDYQVGAGTNPLTKVTVTTKSIIALYNKSDSFLSNAEIEQIPAGSSIVWVPSATNAADSLMLVNTNSDFFFSLNNGETYNFGSLLQDKNGLIGTYKLNSTTAAGKENDLVVARMTLADGNGMNLMIAAHNAINWKYGSLDTNNFQKTTVSISVTSPGGAGTVNGFTAVGTSFTVKGSATASTPSEFIPFIQYVTNGLTKKD